MNKCLATSSYILFIIAVNWLFSHGPWFNFYGEILSPADIIVGAIYILRDFAQREIKHYVIIAMLVGAILSYWLATPTVALASITAFLIGEIIDWLIFSWTKKSLSERLIISSSISAPIDSLVFLAMINHLTWISFIVMNCAKWCGVLILWKGWQFVTTRRLLESTSHS